MTRGADLEIGLSAKGLGNLPRNVYEDDFAFLVGDRVYRCPSFVASFLSPRICRLQTNDPTIREFRIETPDPNEDFERILSLCSGCRLSISGCEAFVHRVSVELWNREVYEEIHGKLSDALSIENVVDRIGFLFSIGADYAAEVEFSAKHFYELEMKDLPFEVIMGIISDESLVLKDEDSLYWLIHDRYVQERQFFSLFEHVRFEYLSSECIESFMKLTNESSFDLMTLGIWRSVCGRLSFPISPASPAGRFAFPSPVEGIISYLTTKHGGHVMDCGTVSITASGIAYAERHPIRNLAIAGSQVAFFTPNQPNSWICYTFNRNRVKLTHYSIRTRFDANANHLRFWILEGSNDGSSWVELDRRDNDRSLNTQGATATFSIREGTRKDFQMIRLRQTGKNSIDNDHLVLSGIEFYGNLFPSKP
jgi:hypothetical protein